jgi:hypothetical protein
MNSRIALLTTIALCAVLLLGATLARPALADQPIPWSGGDQYTEELIDCGQGHKVYIEVSYELEGLDWYAHDGTWVRWSWLGWYSERFFTNWNEAEIQTDRYRWNGGGDCDNRWDTCIVRGMGNGNKVILPGYGVIYHNAGLIINDAFDWNLLKITPHIEWEFSPFCDYFAGQ